MQQSADDEHIQNVLRDIRFLQHLHGVLSIDLAINPLGIDESSVEAATRVDNRRERLREIEACLHDSHRLSASMDPVRSTSPQMNSSVTRSCDFI